MRVEGRLWVFHLCPAAARKHMSCIWRETVKLWGLASRSSTFTSWGRSLSPKQSIQLQAPLTIHNQKPSGPSSCTSEGIWPAAATTFPGWYFEIKSTRFIHGVLLGLWRWDRGRSSGKDWSCGHHHHPVLQGSRPQSHWSVQLYAAIRGLLMRLWLLHRNVSNHQTVSFFYFSETDNY